MWKKKKYKYSSKKMKYKSKWRKRKYKKRESFRDEWIAWVIIIAIIIYAIITAILWILLFWISALLILLAYKVSEHTEDLRLQIFVWLLSIIAIILGWSEILSNYWKINKSIIEYSTDTAQELRLKKWNKGNYKVDSPQGTIIDTRN